MKTIHSYLLFLLVFVGSCGQNGGGGNNNHTQKNTIAGSYVGVFDGNKVTIILDEPNGNNLIGTLKDATGKHPIQGTINGSQFQATCQPANVNVSLTLKGTIVDGQMTFTVMIPSVSSEVLATVTLNKKEESGAMNTTKTGNLDPNLVGAWSRDIELGGTFVDKHTYVLEEDGTYLDKGTAVDGGGSDGNGTWYTDGNELYTVIDGAENLWGTYFITDDGSAMRITYPSGKKVLFVRN